VTAELDGAYLAGRELTDALLFALGQRPLDEILALLRRPAPLLVLPAADDEGEPLT
jgi:hypothetical protein